jgi:hypothetical protein
VYSIKNNNTNNVVSYRNVNKCNKCVCTFVDDNHILQMLKKLSRVLVVTLCFDGVCSIVCCHGFWRANAFHFSFYVNCS